MSQFANILKLAFGMIPHTTVQYRKYQSKTINDFGVATQSYTALASTPASVQPGIVSSFGGKCVELKDYKEMGLDWTRRHITVWMPDVGLEPATNNEGGDQVVYNSMTFNVLQCENWLDYDGWVRIYCVQVQT